MKKPGLNQQPRSENNLNTNKLIYAKNRNYFIVMLSTCISPT